VTDDVRIAAERARQKVGESLWKVLSTREQTDAIYRELRIVDAERIARQATDSHDS
jgi:hypothetical protein